MKWDDTSVHILSHTLHYGTGVFEGVRAYKTPKGSAIFRLKEHTNRLFSAADKINIKIPFTKDELNSIQCEILNKNSLDEGYIRPIVYLGNEGLGLRAKDLSVNVAIAAWEWPSYMDPKAKEKGISVIITDHQVREVLDISDYSYLLFSGEIIAHGTSNKILDNKEARKFYLGDTFKF